MVFLYNGFIGIIWNYIFLEGIAMSGRRTKKQQRQLEEGLTGLLFLIGIACFYFTKSLIQTGIYVGIALVLMLSIVIYLNNKRKQRLRASGIEEIDTMDGIQFEYYLKELYLSRGYAAEVTSASGDYGADLLLTKDGNKVVVQAKRHSKDVGIKAVQEVIGAKSYYAADDAWVVSNRFFTKAAKELAQKSKVTLVDREQLIDLILLINPSIKTQSPQEMKSLPQSPDLRCSKCGSPMVLRSGKRGEFYGCSSFPKCRHTEKVG
jgi:restriction system protein